MPESFNTGLRNVACNYIKLLNVKVTTTSIKRDIEENPYYPSLLSLSDTFNRYQIRNIAYEATPEKFIQFEPPFVAFLMIPGVGRDFVLVTNLTDDSVSYLYKNNSTKRIGKTDFFKQYQNIIWTSSPDKFSGEQNFEEKRRREKSVIYKRNSVVVGLIAAILLAVLGNLPNMNSIISYLVILLLKSTGIVISTMILMYETDKTNAFIKNICTAGKQTSCESVLGSKAGKILGISWGEIGFIYFASSFLLIIFPAMTFDEKSVWLAFTSMCAAPFVIFSIYYQWRVVKAWCLLCLSVQLVLTVELVWVIFNFSFVSYSFANKLLGILFNSKWNILLCSLLPIVIWFGIKPFLVRVRDADLYAAAYKRLQYNPEIFESILIQQPKAPDGWQNIGIDIGNKDAKNIIVKVCNPYCGPCAKVHPMLEAIIKQNDNVKLKIIFTAKNTENDPGSIVVKHLLMIAAQKDKQSMQKAMDDWYYAEKKDYETFSQRHCITSDLNEYGSDLDSMSKWCSDAEIAFTPTIFVNGYRLPENYTISELTSIL